jgi:hypothetical protein
MQPSHAAPTQPRDHQMKKKVSDDGNKCEAYKNDSTIPKLETVASTNVTKRSDKLHLNRRPLRLADEPN